MTDATVQDLDEEVLWSLQEFSAWLRKRWPGQRGLTYYSLLARRHEFAHVHIGKAFLLTAEQRRAFIARYTQEPAKPTDGLDATRERIARQRSRTTAPKPRSRKAA